MMNEPKRFQWRLQSVLLLVTLLSLYLGLWRDTRTIYEQRFDAGVLPSNDQALVDWFQDQPAVEEVRVSREGTWVTVQFAKRKASFDILSPPLASLGYESLRTSTTRITPTTTVGTAWRWALRVPQSVWVTLAIGSALCFLWITLKKRASSPVVRDQSLG
ncbi:MAG: hypothetical protein U0905_05675 [Pirellulales bacterium]